MSNPTVRASLIVAATILAFIGLIASVQDNWHLSSFVWTAAYARDNGITLRDGLWSDSTPLTYSLAERFARKESA